NGSSLVTCRTRPANCRLDCDEMAWLSDILAPFCCPASHFVPPRRRSPGHLRTLPGHAMSALAAAICYLKVSAIACFPMSTGREGSGCDAKPSFADPGHPPPLFAASRDARDHHALRSNRFHLRPAAGDRLEPGLASRLSSPSTATVSALGRFC